MWIFTREIRVKRLHSVSLQSVLVIAFSSESAGGMKGDMSKHFFLVRLIRVGTKFILYVLGMYLVLEEEAFNRTGF